MERLGSGDIHCGEEYNSGEHKPDVEDKRVKTILKVAVVVAAAALLPCSLQAAELTSQVKMHKGVPALYVNGKLTSQVLAAPYKPDPSDLKDFLKAGISIFDIYLRFRWSGPGQYDFSKSDAKLESYLKLDPHALFLPRILLTPGAWWCKDFPNDITMHPDGTPAGMFGAPCHPSFASEKYRKLSHQAMIAFLKHFESKFGNHIVGYQVGNGFGGEWLTFNSFWEIHGNQRPPTKFGVEDYSPVAKAAFRRWLRKKYRTVAKLRAAWGDPRVTFATATPPGEVARYTTTHGIFFDPAISRRVPDYFTFFNQMVGNVLLENARWVKEFTHGKKIVGAFYGYLYCNFPNLSVVHSGHLDLARVLRSHYIDFIASPYSYTNKQIGGPDYSQTLPTEVQLHGKLYFNEVDTDTYLHQIQWRWGNSLNNPKSFQQTKGLLVRDYAYALAKGFGMWWTDLFGGNFHAPDIIHLLRQLKQIDEKNLKVSKRSNAQIAVILSESSFTYCGDGEPLWNALISAQAQYEFAYIGAPWDQYLLSDIGNPKLRDYKLYIFLNTFHVTPQERAAIHARLKRNHATAIWVYAPGYISNKLSLATMRELTGIRLAESDTTGELHVNITSEDSPYTKGLPKDLAYGTDVNVTHIIRWYDHQIYLKDPRDPSLQRDLPGFRISPRFWSDDPKVKVLGTLAGFDKPGLVVKQMPGWTSIYSSAPILPAALLRDIARAAGVNIYDTGNDVVYADGNFLGIYSPKGGKRTIRLPQTSRVVNLLTDRVIAEHASQFPLNLAPNESVLLRIEH